MRNFQGTFETSKRPFFSAFSICITEPLRLQFHCAVFFAKHLLNACEIKEFWLFSIQPAELLLYFTGIFMLNGKQLLNKLTKFSQKMFFNFRMISL